MTAATLKQLLTVCNVPFKKSSSLPVLHGIAVDHFLEDPAEREELKKKMTDDRDAEVGSVSSCSNMSEILDMLEENENQGDADLKKEKERLNKKRKAAQQRAVLKESRGMKTATAKSKPKAKAKAKSSAVAKQNLLLQLRLRKRKQAAGTAGSTNFKTRSPWSLFFGFELIQPIQPCK